MRLDPVPVAVSGPLVANRMLIAAKRLPVASRCFPCASRGFPLLPVRVSAANLC